MKVYRSVIVVWTKQPIDKTPAAGVLCDAVTGIRGAFDDLGFARSAYAEIDVREADVSELDEDDREALAIEEE